MAAADSGVKDMYLVMSNDTSIVLSPAAGLTNGFTGTVSVPSGRVRLVLDAAYENGGSAIRVPVCTVADGALADSFSLVHAKGYSAALETEAVTCGGVACVRYSVKYRPEGALMVIR